MTDVKSIPEQFMRCPSCGSYDITHATFNREDDGCGWQDCWCNNPKCNLFWTEIFMFQESKIPANVNIITFEDEL